MRRYMFDEIHLVLPDGGPAAWLCPAATYEADPDSGAFLGLIDLDYAARNGQLVSLLHVLPPRVIDHVTEQCVEHWEATRRPVKPQAVA